MRTCRKCRGAPVVGADLCGPCFAAANGVRWAMCAECVVEGLIAIDDTTGGYWHVECAAFALSVVDNPHSHCRYCRIAKPSADGVVDYRDRIWCFKCAAEALGRLRVARSGLAHFRDPKTKQ